MKLHYVTAKLCGKIAKMMLLYISKDIQLLFSNQYNFQFLIASNQYIYQHPINTPARCRSVQLSVTDYCSFQIPISTTPITSLLIMSLTKIPPTVVEFFPQWCNSSYSSGIPPTLVRSLLH